jgi:hypothetical protein
MRVRLRRSSVRTATAAALVLMLAGCATMPDSGTPGGSADSQGNDSLNSQVVIIAVPPAVDEKPSELLSDFLADQTTDEATFATARQYLMSSSVPWQPQQKVTVLENIRQRTTASTANSETLVVTGQEEAALDSRGVITAYGTASGSAPEAQETFTFAKNAKGQWRITSLPDGLILSQQDFQRLYESGDLYFPAKTPVDSGELPPLVADPIWLRSRIDPLTDAARELLEGPTAWLDPVVAPGAGSGISLAAPVTVGSDNVASVYLKGPDSSLLSTANSCYELASQLYSTLVSVSTDQAPQAWPGVKSVQLFSGSDQQAACTEGSGNPYALTTGDTAYFVGSSGHLMSLNVVSGASARVAGLLEPSAAGGIGAFAVEPGAGSDVAVVTPDGQDLYVSTLTAAAAPGQPTLAVSFKGTGGVIGSPSWDSTGTLWVTDSDPAAASSVMAVSGAAGRPEPVSVQGLPAGWSVTGLKVADDGARIALIVSSGSGAQQVEVGRVERSGTASAEKLTVSGVHPVAEALTSVTSMSWADDDSLIVLGQSANAAGALSTWQIDGSSALVPAAAPLQATDGMQTVSALESDSVSDQFAPILGGAGSGGRIYAWQAKTAAWRPLTSGAVGGNGPMPSYPG